MSQVDKYAVKRKQEEQFAWLQKMVTDAQLRGWYGVITIKMEQGMIRQVQTSESHIPPT